MFFFSRGWRNDAFPRFAFSPSRRVLVAHANWFSAAFGFAWFWMRRLLWKLSEKRNPIKYVCREVWSLLSNEREELPISGINKYIARYTFWERWWWLFVLTSWQRRENVEMSAIVQIWLQAQCLARTFHYSFYIVLTTSVWRRFYNVTVPKLWERSHDVTTDKWTTFL